ncbi:MAG: tetratricopeptide repeat protein, partial [Hyphococcus sp.]
MKTKLFASAAVGALALAGVSIGVSTVETETVKTEDTAAPFLHPLMIARSLCGENPDGLAKRRAFFVRAARAYAQTSEDAPSDAPMIRPGLSDIAYSVTTAKPEAQAWFDQGVAFTYNFNHGEAVKAFRQAQAIDPECAMCFWGEAFALGPNINAPMMPDAVAPAWAALQKAIALRDTASDKEQALINALGYRYAAAAPEDRAKLDNAFADAMDDVARAYPEDDFIAALAAEANMDTQPWD